MPSGSDGDASSDGGDAGSDAQIGCAEDPEHDPLLGDWIGEQAHVSDRTCSFYSNGRYRCQVGLSGGPEEWSRLEQGRYFFSALSLGVPSTVIGVATFNEDCTQLTLALENGHSLKLERKP